MRTNRVALITGGSSGIGFAIAKKMIENHVDVTIMGRKEDALSEAATKLQGSIHWIRGDVSDRPDVERAVKSIADRTGTIDILVNNAGKGGGITTKIPLSEAEAVWDDVSAVNLKGAFLMTMAAAPILKRPGGRIINISSIGAFTGGSRAGGLAYAASKSGLHGLTFASARELSKEGITVNAIAPGLITETNFFNGQLTEKRLNQTVSQIPAGRAGQPSDIASAVWYLASPDASYINGEILNVNGGWMFGR
ncbi:SDR family oxidoreductase [Sporolactobacillus shoreicorticis]|uniref:SDR family NAD(P)-dependent oxidoreductase n=1 Tax=Sporolactobacillus shoreicorticis TaxID=1923877 RepID=A0ABW5RYP0_9BACL|nr:SDR family oxidoreductase [Sporolactobacillus shoreicorticis]MCO7124762.1 SDR family oxidoreductase [Sporolactobacillus shoreicorticis]